MNVSAWKKSFIRVISAYFTRLVFKNSLYISAPPIIQKSVYFFNSESISLKTSVPEILLYLLDKTQLILFCKGGLGMENNVRRPITTTLFSVCFRKKSRSCLKLQGIALCLDTPKSASTIAISLIIFCTLSEIPLGNADLRLRESIL